MRKGICVGFALVLSVAVAACGGSKGQTGVASSSGAGSSKQYAELRVGMLEFSGPLSWHRNGWLPTGIVPSLACQGVVQMAPDGAVEMGLASSAEHPNPTTYIYSIRPGVKFSDGQPLTVADVVYSLDLNKSEDSQTRSVWEGVASVSADGSSAVAVKLSKPDVDWPVKMAYSSQVIEKAAAEKAGGEKTLGTSGNLPTCTGPWKFESYTPNVSVHLSRNPYWNGSRQPAQKITVVFFKTEAAMALALRSGAIDEATDYTLQKLFAAVPGTHPLGGAQGLSDILIMNTAYPPFNDVHVRRAVAYATDVNGMLKALFPAGGATRPASIAPDVTLAHFGVSPSQVNEVLRTVPQYSFDLAAARRELAKSSYPNGFATEIQALVSEPVLIEAAQVLSSDLAKIGINAKVHALATDEFQSMYGSKVKLLLNETYMVYPAPDRAPFELLAEANIEPPGPGTNWASYRNAEVNKLLAEEAQIANPTRRLQPIGKILKIAATELPYLQLFQHGAFATLANKYVDPTWSMYSSLYSPWALSVKLAE